MAKNFFSGLGSRSSSYRNTICVHYVKQIEKIGEYIFTYQRPKEKLTPILSSQVFSDIYSELKGRLIIDLDGNRNTTIVDETYQKILNRFAYEISLSQKNMTNTSVPREENLQNKKEMLENDPKNPTTNIILNNCTICCNENTTDTIVSQSSKKIINPEPENIIYLLLKKICSYVLNLF